MTAKIYAQPAAPGSILDEDFDVENLHPADIEQIIIAAYDEYEAMPKFTKLRKQYRIAYNNLVTALTEKRGYKQYNSI